MDFKISGKRLSPVEREYLFNLGYCWCSTCKTAKPFEDFVKNKNTPTGFDYCCRECTKTWRINNAILLKKYSAQRYSSNKEVMKAQSRKYKLTNPERVKEIRCEYYSKNKEQILKKNAEYYYNNKDKVLSTIKRRVENDKIRVYGKQKEWRKNHIEHLREVARNRYNTDPDFKLKCVYRQLVRRMYLAINTSKNNQTSDILGYSPIELKQHIEKQFKEGMSWNNYGKWHIDHIIPICNATTEKEGILLSQLDNLQPLWAEENLSKGCR